MHVTFSTLITDAYHICYVNYQCLSHCLC